MRRDGRQEAQQAPRPRPSVENWLDSVPPSTTKPTPEELRQWDLDDRGNSGRSFFFTTIGLRAMSLLAAVASVISGLTLITYRSRLMELMPTLIVCSIIAACDATEFVTMCARGGQGLPWWVHIAVDVLIVIGTAVAASFSFIDLPWQLDNRNYPGMGFDVARQITCLALSVLLILLHSSLAILFWSARVRGRAEKQKTEPRIMYLPTGDPVVVTREPIVPPAAAPPPPSPAAAPPPPSPAAPRDPGTDNSIHEPFRQGVPPRKPVAGPPVRPNYAPPAPGSDYQPDEAELARAARGELQAQRMTCPQQEKVVMGYLPTTGRRADERSPTAGART